MDTTAIKHEVKQAVKEILPLLRGMNATNLDETHDRVEAIRHTLNDEQDELTMFSILLKIGEL